MRRSLSAFVLLLSLAQTPSALADGVAGLKAYEAGDYATALKEFLPLAEAGQRRHEHRMARGAQARDDFKERDDANWLKHTLWYSQGNRLDYKPVTLQPMSADVEPIALAKRTY